jgi:hypothetical protein
LAELFFNVVRILMMSNGSEHGFGLPLPENMRLFPSINFINQTFYQSPSSFAPTVKQAPTWSITLELID